MKKGKEPTNIVATAIEPQIVQNPIKVTDYNETLLLAQNNLDKLINSVCTYEWEKELVDKFR